MRIYFVGAHSTGKTTLCRYVSTIYHIPMISEVARTILAELETNLKSLRADINVVNDYQEKIFNRQFLIEKRTGENFVSDRAFDNLAYAAEHTTILSKLMNSQLFKEYINWIKESVVFFVRPHKELLVYDGIREGDWESVVRIDGMIKLLLEQFDIAYVIIDSLFMQERIRTIDYVLKACWKN